VLCLKQDEGTDALDAAAQSDPWEKFNPLLHGGAAHAAGATTAGRKKAIELLKISFVKKYVSYAKQRVKPELSDAARDLIVQNYSELRQKQVDGAVAMPITARSLETIIRLSTAHAKARLSKNVEESDVRSAFGLMEFALHHEATSSEKVRRKKKSKTNSGAGTSADASGDDDSDDDGAGPSGDKPDDEPVARPPPEGALSCFPPLVRLCSIVGEWYVVQSLR
jgi:DNA replication licensing factor MCM3